ncbi:glycosyl hydrolase [Rhizobium sp. CG5]|uniref:glycoside hydrolase family 25 protein n=1 Tax=Rhizobium sp. CG5 TaxID=2726076 RepID=UPI00203476C8|nr:GH25 family lysozyme [Rhizobium sp. CG5]MCM2476617.1 glycosyl hydrolase [Rhizobium sp. CG5]
MRLSTVSAIALACLLTSGCSTSTPDTALAVSPETTSAVAVRSGPVPASNVGAAAPVAGDPHELAWAGPVPGGQPAMQMQAQVQSQTQALEPMASSAGMPVPGERTVAMLVPMPPQPQPEAPAAPSSRSRSQIYSQKFRDAKPINFGPISPRSHAVHGVDISRWQGEIDWAKLRTQGANFAFIKATDGGDHLDPMFKTNWKRAKEAGIRRGAYHFFYWCRTAGEQADWFIRNVPKEVGALPPVIDVEWNGESSCSQRISRKRVLEKIKVFADKLERHYGQRPIIYTAPDFYEDNLTGEFLDHPFWLRSVAAHPSKRYPNRKWVFWQYSGSGLSQGVKGKIDLNVFHGSEQQWHDWVAAKAR